MARNVIANILGARGLPGGIIANQNTAAQFTVTNPILAGGELGLEKDTGKTKLGDGSTTWNALPYQPNTADLNATYAPASGSANYVHAVIDSTGGVTLYQNGVEL